MQEEKGEAMINVDRPDDHLIVRQAFGTAEPWYHGASREGGLEAGDTLDPRMSSFEGVIWATSDRAHAYRFARDQAVLDNGEPVVYRVVLRSGTKIKFIEKSREIEKDLREAKAEGYDAIRIEIGENGKPELAILREGVATVHP